MRSFLLPTAVLAGGKSLCCIFLLTCACIHFTCHPDCQSSQVKVRTVAVMRTTSGVTLGVGGALTAAGAPFFFPTKGTFFKKKTYPVLPVYLQWSASKWPVFICDTHQGVRRETRCSFCQLFFAPRPKSNGSRMVAGPVHAVTFQRVLSSPWKTADRVTASVSRPQTEMDILVETFPSCLNWVRGGAIKQHSSKTDRM